MVSYSGTTDSGEENDTVSRTAFPRGQRLTARKDVGELRAVEKAIRDRAVHRWRVPTTGALNGGDEGEAERTARLLAEQRAARLLRRRLRKTADTLGAQLKTAIVYEEGRWVVVYEAVDPDS